MYCPVCFNSTLHFSRRGVLNIIINGKQMDAGRILYNIKDEINIEFRKDLEKKIEEFFKWYSNFQNREVITKIELMTSDVVCDNKCKVPLDTKFSVIDSLISKKLVIQILMKTAEQYDFDIDLEEE